MQEIIKLIQSMDFDDEVTICDCRVLKKNTEVIDDINNIEDSVKESLESMTGICNDFDEQLLKRKSLDEYVKTLDQIEPEDIEDKMSFIIYKNKAYEIKK